jgi:hypothetical protein
MSDILDDVYVPEDDYEDDTSYAVWAWRKSIQAATPLQTGGRYAHLLNCGDSTVIDGIPALIRELDRLSRLIVEGVPERFRGDLAREADVALFAEACIIRARDAQRGMRRN